MTHHFVELGIRFASNRTEHKPAESKIKRSFMKNKYKRLSVLGAAVIASGLLCQQVQAASITGSITISGVATLNSTSLATATAATAFPFSFVTLGSGSYAATPGSLVTYFPFSWSPASTPVTPLWTFTSLGTTYSFDLSSLAIDTQNAAFLNLSGAGTAHVTGLTDTAGTWTFTATSTGTSVSAMFGFVSSETSVPDGGLTVALLGFALVGVEGLRRKLRK